jgi:altronate dehydratase small subunit
MRRDAIIIHKQDNVATAIRDITGDQPAAVGVEEEVLTVQVRQPIPFGHKFALRRIQSGEDILKYGVVIGRATQDIQTGEHVHVHNVESETTNELHGVSKSGWPRGDEKLRGCAVNSGMCQRSGSQHCRASQRCGCLQPPAGVLPNSTGSGPRHGGVDRAGIQSQPCGGPAGQPWM